MVSECKGVQCKNYTLCSLIFCVKCRKFTQTLLMIIFQWYNYEKVKDKGIEIEEIVKNYIQI